VVHSTLPLHGEDGKPIRGVFKLRAAVLVRGPDDVTQVDRRDTRPLPEPPIAFGWPMSCSVNRAGRLYVADVLNQRIVRVDLPFAADAVAPAGR
jgi:hypothetical protein